MALFSCSGTDLALISGPPRTQTRKRTFVELVVGQVKEVLVPSGSYSNMAAENDTHIVIHLHGFLRFISPVEHVFQASTPTGI